MKLLYLTQYYKHLLYTTIPFSVTVKLRQTSQYIRSQTDIYTEEIPFITHKKTSNIEKEFNNLKILKGWISLDLLDPEKHKNVISICISLPDTTLIKHDDYNIELSKLGTEKLDWLSKRPIKHLSIHVTHYGYKIDLNKFPSIESVKFMQLFRGVTIPPYIKSLYLECFGFTSDFVIDKNIEYLSCDGIVNNNVRNVIHLMNDKQKNSNVKHITVHKQKDLKVLQKLPNLLNNCERLDCFFELDSGTSLNFKKLKTLCLDKASDAKKVFDCGHLVSGEIIIKNGKVSVEDKAILRRAFGYDWTLITE